MVEVLNVLNLFPTHVGVIPAPKIDFRKEVT